MFDLTDELEQLAVELSRMKEDLARAMRRARKSTEKAAEADKLRARLEQCVPKEELIVVREEARRRLAEAADARQRMIAAEHRVLGMVPAADHNAVLELVRAEAHRASAAEKKIECLEKALHDLSATKNCLPIQSRYFGNELSKSDLSAWPSSGDEVFTGHIHSDLLKARSEAQGLKAEVNFLYFMLFPFSFQNICVF